MVDIFAGSAQYPKETPSPVVTIGNFDGVHVGHQHLLERTLQHAKERNAPACVFTFEPSPRSLLSPNLKVPRIALWNQKVFLLKKMGVDHIVLERFSKAFAQHSAEWFVREIIAKRLRAQALIVGYDFRFGRARAGNSGLVRKLLPNIFLEEVKALTRNGEIVSSSAIRSKISSGAVESALQLLGRPHMVKGVVISGAQRGRQLGFPTANLQLDAELIPANGVYAVKVRVDGGRWICAVANLGLQPTFMGHSFQIEVHILDFSQDIYGCEVEVCFFSRLRAEQRFSSSADLISQLRVDIQKVREFFEQKKDIDLWF